MNNRNETGSIAFEEEPRVTDTNSKETKERSHEENLEIIDLGLKEILRSQHRANEGNNGIIFRMPLIDASPLFLEALGAIGADITSEAAIKMLKVYSPGSGSHEFNMQQMAYDLLKDMPDEDYAKIPKPVLIRELDIDSGTVEHLREEDSNFRGAGKAEVIIMDWISGEDLATALYKWTIEHHENPILPGNFSDFNELQDSIARTFHFVKPGGKSNRENERINEERLVKNENAQKVFTFMRSKGFTLNPKIVKQITNTLNLLHENSIYHNDNHERNILIDGAVEAVDGKGASVQTYLLDFGSADTKRVEDRFEDTDIITRIEDYLQPAPSALEVFESNIQKELLTIQNDKNYKQMSLLMEKIKGPDRLLTMAFSFFPGIDGKYKFAATCKIFIDQGLITQIDIQKFIEPLLGDKKRSPSEKEILTLISKENSLAK